MKTFQNRLQPVIHFRGRSYSIGDAAALASNELNLGHFQAVVEIYNLILAKVPGSAGAYVNRGVALQAMKRFEDALASFDKAIALNPGHAEFHNNRGAVLQKMNRFEEALASYDKAISLKPDYVNPHQNRGSILKNLNRNDEALASFDKAIALKPDYAEAHNHRGLVLMNQGFMPEAEKMFLKALALKPDFPAALFNLTTIRKYQNTDNADARTIGALLQKTGLSLEDQEQLHFALGKIYDDCDQYDEAFMCYQRANQIRNSMVSYDSEHVTRMTDDIINVFSKDFLARPFEFGSDGRSPLFIVGMPRSGTTLLASILSNHRSIATAGRAARHHGFYFTPFAINRKQAPLPAGGETFDSGSGHAFDQRLHAALATGLRFQIASLSLIKIRSISGILGLSQCCFRRRELFIAHVILWPWAFPIIFSAFRCIWIMLLT